MIQLKPEYIDGCDGFGANRRIYTQVKRNKHVALYKRTIEASGRIEGYEVFAVAVKPKGTKVYSAVLEDDEEQYATASQFGVHDAAFVMTMDRAEEYFKQFTENFEHKLEKQETKAKGESVKHALTIPVKEFTVTDLAEANSVNYTSAFLFVKAEVEKGSIKFVREERRHIKGKATRIYTKA